MKFLVLAFLSIAASSSFGADQEKEVLACVANAAADVDGGRSYQSDASPIRFLLTLHRQGQAIIAAQQKYTGAMEGYSSEVVGCSPNQSGNLYSCVGGAHILWYYPAKKHGAIASMNVAAIFNENRGNAAGIYNYSCSTF